MIDILKKNCKFKVIMLVFFVITCLIRHPNFEEAVWSSSDTNYQCLMNVSAMQQTDRLTGKILPIITYSDGTDYGLEYSSGAFDKVSHEFFYYISFPAFPFVLLKTFFDITTLPISIEVLFVFCNILYGITLWFTISMFQYLFVDKISDNIIVFVSGITFCCSTEIMHSLGLTYWGHNWYMLFFPLLVISLIEYIKNENKKNMITLGILSILIMQTEWTGYLAVGAILLILIFQKKVKNTRIMCIIIGLEMFLSGAFFLISNMYVVGKTSLLSTLIFRAEGRMRNVEYSIYDRGIVLFQSFGVLIFVCIFLLVWCLLDKGNVKVKGIILDEIKANKYAVVLFIIPILENFILSNHAIVYSMDRMKIFYILCFALLTMITIIKDSYTVRKLILLLLTFCMLINLGVYRFFDNNYLWNDDRLKDSEILAQYILEEYDDCAIGQLGNDSVWGYSKLLFGKGIEKNSSTDSVDTRAKNLNKRYAISLNGVNLSNTQYWYTSAVIHDLNNDEYKVIGTIPRQYELEFDDYAFLKYFENITVYENGFVNEIATINEKEVIDASDLDEYLENIYNDNSTGNNLYYIAQVKTIPRIIKLADITQNEWNHGIDYTGNRLIINKTNTTSELLENANSFVVDNEEIEIKKMEMDQNYFFITIDETAKINLEKMKYPNNVEVKKDN